MTALDRVLLVARREIRDRLSSKGYLLLTFGSVLLVVGIVIAPSLFDDDGPSEVRIGVTDDAGIPATFPDAAASTASAFGFDEATVVELADRAAAEDAVEHDEVDAALVGARELLVPEPSSRLDDYVTQSLQSARLSRFLADADVDRVALQEASSLPDVTQSTLSGEDAAARETQFGIGFAITILLFLTLQFNGNSVLTTTVEEKSSRVVEVLLGTLRPWQLLAGKLVAMTALSVGQLLLYVAGGVTAAMLVGDFTLPATTTATVVTSIVMFLVGFALYAAIYAVAGALAGSAEEAQAAAGPIGFVSAAVYMAVIIGVVPSPDGVFARVLTFVPFSAPFAVPVRTAAGIPAWEAGLAFVVTAVAAVMVVRLAGRLYSAAVLSGGKMTWRAAFRAEPIR